MASSLLVLAILLAGSAWSRSVSDDKVKEDKGTEESASPELGLDFHRLNKVTSKGGRQGGAARVIFFLFSSGFGLDDVQSLADRQLIKADPFIDDFVPEEFTDDFASNAYSRGSRMHYLPPFAVAHPQVRVRGRGVAIGGS